MARDEMGDAVSAGDEEALRQQLQLAAELQGERPSIDAALKNYVSLLTARLSTSGGVAPGVAKDSTAQLDCARVFAKALNCLELPTHVEWGKLYPQLDGETALDFMTRLGRLRVVRALWLQCTKAGQKPSKCLGRSSLEAVFPELERRVFDEAEEAKRPVALRPHLRAFSDGLRATLAARAADDAKGGAEGDAAAEAPLDDAQSDHELVWCAELGAVLAARQRSRQLEAQGRVERAASAQDFASELRSALGAPAASTVEVEEVED
mmetsp:Transcript_100986/g.308814  ORF Transcript_100986/g.308814 Transcript_100986/m.308814 type:complete len:265 (-) Transcript_100986:150-944(-)